LSIPEETSLYPAELFVEKEDEAVFWIGKFGTDFTDKLNARFGQNFTPRTLFQKLGKALTSGSRDIVFDWLCAAELHSLMQNGNSQEEADLKEDRVFVMIDAGSENTMNIPFSLKRIYLPDSEYLLRIVKRLKNSLANRDKKAGENTDREGTAKNEGFFLTTANVQPIDRNSPEVIKLMAENEKLKKELERSKATNEGAIKQSKTDKEIVALKQSLAELEIEMSVIPALKKQLKERNREVEILNMYAREVEICAKIRAPIPTLSTYKAGLEGGKGEKEIPSEDQYQKGSHNKFAGRTESNLRSIQKRSTTGNGPLKRSSDRNGLPAYPSKELLGIYSGKGSRQNSLSKQEVTSRSITFKRKQEGNAPTSQEQSTFDLKWRLLN